MKVLPTAFDLIVTPFGDIQIHYQECRQLRLATFVLHNANLSRLKYNMWRCNTARLALNGDYEKIVNPLDICADDYSYYFVPGKDFKKLSFGMQQG